MELEREVAGFVPACGCGKTLLPLRYAQILRDRSNVELGLATPLFDPNGPRREHGGGERTRRICSDRNNMSDGAQNISGGVAASPADAPSFWRIPWEFAVHALVGTIIFGIIAGAAVLLELAVRGLEAYGIGSVIIVGLHAAEYALFTSDLVLFSVFLWRTAKRTIKSL